MPHSFEQIEGVAGALGAVQAGRPWMSIGQVDGYVTGIAVCPEAIAPSEWLPPVWGGAGAASFGARRESEVHAVIAHYHRVARSLYLSPEDYTPLYEVGGGRDGAAVGLVDRGLRAGDGATVWSLERVRQGFDREAAASLAMIGALYDIDLGRSALDEAAVAEMERIAPDLIPTFVQTLKRWSAWRGGRGTAEDAARGSNVVPFRRRAGRAGAP